jgi:hypothetical protein
MGAVCIYHDIVDMIYFPKYMWIGLLSWPANRLPRYMQSYIQGEHSNFERYVPIKKNVIARF